MPRLIAVALYHRDHISRGTSRQTFGYEAFHWAIASRLQEEDEHDWQVFEATDASRLDPVTFRLINPNMDWYFSFNKDEDLGRTQKLLGHIVIGEISQEVSTSELRGWLEKVPLPIKHTHPQQSCVSWTVDAIQQLQGLGWAREFEIDQFKDSALAYADERLKDGESKQLKLKYYSADK